ncbi:MAG: hypothetical protein WBD71_03680, partial [Xanthobacteraceae bacterium]
MSLTGCPSGAAATPAQRAAERVELMALLWQILDGDAAYCVNPRLLMATRFVPELQTAAATGQLRALRQTTNRDSVIKGLVTAAHVSAAHVSAAHVSAAHVSAAHVSAANWPPIEIEIAGLAASLDALSEQWDGLLGGLAAPLTATYRQMRERAAPLSAGMDPAADMTAVTGEHDPLELVILPSLFLPPPQNGRHSVLVDAPAQGAVAYLLFGYPLDDDPLQFGINRYWLLGGAWHYAVDRFIERHWPAMAAELRAMPKLKSALTTALAEHRETVIWPQVVAEHVSIAVKCLLCDYAEMPQIVHLGFARTQGLAFFAWFRDWMTELARHPDTFAAKFRHLPQAMRSRQDELVAVATAAPSGPASLNFALASREHRPIIVLPDHWNESLRQRISRRWSLVTGEILRASEWCRIPDPAPASLIAFGQVGRDRMIDELLTRRGLTLEETAEGGDLLVSLFPPERARKPWQIAIAVHDPE